MNVYGSGFIPIINYALGEIASEQGVLLTEASNDILTESSNTLLVETV